MNLLLTSAGIRNPSIQNALVSMLDQPIAESNALCIPTACYAQSWGAVSAWNFISEGNWKRLDR